MRGQNLNSRNPERVTVSYRPPTDQHRPTGSEYGDALSDVLADQKRRAKARDTAGKPRARKRVHPAVALVLVPITVWLWIAPPDILGPRPIPEVSLERREVGVKAEIVLLAKRLEAWSAENGGKLPADLEEAGEERGEIRYLRLTATTYRLRAEVDTLTIDYHSTDSLEEFFAEAKVLIERGEIR